MKSSFRIIIVGIIALLSSITLSYGQATANVFVVELTDKDDSPYSIHRPWEFLSPRAIERRRKQGIAIDETDIPINPRYLEKIEGEAELIRGKSKWMNSVIVVANEEQLGKIKALPFVKSAAPVSVNRNTRRSHTPPEIPRKQYESIGGYYGYGSTQIGMMNGHLLHSLGHEGQGMLVGVMDGGFTNVDVSPFFDSLRVNGRLWQGRDMVHNDMNPYEDISHGTQVLSTMAAKLPGLFVGTGPEASYFCVKTEETGSENPVEEEFWIAGLEYADSLGSDVINTSLGYTHFDLKDLNHSKKDLDGETIRASRAGSLAANKGMLIVVSAGNEGNGKWGTISSPSDAFDILTVGAATKKGQKAGFSSMGPTADGRVKPEVSALGRNAAVASTRGYDVRTSNGTSFASPILAGMVTSLWSAYPEKSWDDIRNAVIESGNQYENPDSLLGYGIPDIAYAYGLLNEIDASYHQYDPGSLIFKDDDIITVFFNQKVEWAPVSIVDIMGNTVDSFKVKQGGGFGVFQWKVPENLPPGFYRFDIEADLQTTRVHYLHRPQGVKKVKQP